MAEYSWYSATWQGTGLFERLNKCFGLLTPIDNRQLTFWRTLLRISSESYFFCTE